MAATFFGIAVDCNDAAALARFWGAVLDRQVAEGATAQHAILLVSDDPAAGRLSHSSRYQRPRPSRTASTSTSSAIPSTPKPGAC